jgi:hypothetical protein
MDTKMQECIDNCSDCHNVCLQTLNYCLRKGRRARRTLSISRHSWTVRKSATPAKTLCCAVLTATRKLVVFVRKSVANAQSHASNSLMTSKCSSVLKRVENALTAAKKWLPANPKLNRAPTIEGSIVF